MAHVGLSLRCGVPCGVWVLGEPAQHCQGSGCFTVVTPAPSAEWALAKHPSNA